MRASFLPCLFLDPAPALGVRLELVGAVAAPEAREIVFTGNSMWVAQDLRGMTRYDVSDLEHPSRRRVFSPDEIQPMDLRASDPGHLVIADRFRGLVTWDVHRDDRPTSIASVEYPGGTPTSLELAYAGGRTFALVALAGEGLACYDITRPDMPFLTAHFHRAIDFSRRVAVMGRRVLLADSTLGGLKILELTSTGSLVPRREVRLYGRCDSVSVSGATVFATFRTVGLRILTFPDPDNLASDPVERTWTLRSRSDMRQVRAAGTLLFTANGGFGLEVYDWKNPSLPRLVDQVGTDGPGDSAQAVVLRGITVYLASWEKGVKVFHITTRSGRIEELEELEK